MAGDPGEDHPLGTWPVHLIPGIQRSSRNKGTGRLPPASRIEEGALPSTGTGGLPSQSNWWGTTGRCEVVPATAGRGSSGRGTSTPRKSSHTAVWPATFLYWYMQEGPPTLHLTLQQGIAVAVPQDTPLPASTVTHHATTGRSEPRTVHQATHHPPRLSSPSYLLR